MYPETILPIAAHIPHAGTEIPNAVLPQFTVSPEELWHEILTLTDWFTDELFGLPGIATTQTPISRLVVDLERYADDELEEKAAHGQGVIYTHCSNKLQIRREPTHEERRLQLDSWYRPYHLQLELNIEQQIERWGHCLLLDCHSFPAKPFGFENDQGRLRPDICLGSGANTPTWLLDYCVHLLQHHGYSVAVDFPYAGCLVPASYQCDTRVPAIMLEINRKLYMEIGETDQVHKGQLPERLDRFDAVKNDIWAVMLSLSGVTACRLG